MPITSETARIAYTITTSPQSFAVPFVILTASDVAVVATSTSGVDSALVLNSDYTVTGAGTNPSTAQVVGITGRVGQTLTIYRNAALTQPATYVSNDRFPAETTETALNRLTMFIQQVALKVQRALRLPVTNGEAAELTITERASKLLGFDEDGDIEFTSPQSIIDQAVAAAGAFASGTVIEVATVAALKQVSVASLPTNFHAAILGKLAAGDGGQGSYYYNSASSATPDDFSVVQPNAGSGRWLRLMDSGDLTPEQFGAAGNGVTDDTAELQLMLDAAQAFGRDVLLQRPYRITESIVVRGPCRIRGGSGHKLIYDGPGGIFPYNHAVLMESEILETVEKPIAGSAALNTTAVTMTGPEAALFSVGDPVCVWFGVDKYDPNQPHYSYFTKVSAVGGSSITLFDGFPEACAIRRLRYDTSTLSGGVFAEGDVITQGGASATVTFPHPGHGGATPALLAVSNVVGTFAAGNITNGAATATLVASFDSSASVNAQYAVTVRKLARVCENVILENLNIEHTFGVGVVGSGAVCANFARTIIVRNLYTPKNVIGVAGFNTHNLLIENLVCPDLVATSYAAPAAVHGWNQVNTIVRNLDARTDTAIVNLESQCRNVQFFNTCGRRIGGGSGGLVLSIARGCTGVVFHDTIIQQDVATQVMRTVRDTSQDTDIRYVNMEIRGSFSDGTPLNRIEGTLCMDLDGTQKYYRSIKREIRRLALQPGVGTSLQLPRGPYSRCRVFFSTATGITGVSLVGTGGSESGNGENISTLPPAAATWVTALAFETPSAGNRGISRKSMTITADGTLPSQSFVLVDFVCWNDDSTEMSAFNLGLGVSDGILSGDGAPASSAVQPRFLGDMYFDYTNGKFYQSDGTSGSSWVILN